jgi:hypothetical protein
MLLPQFYGHFLGLNSQVSQFKTSHVLSDGTKESSKELFYGTDVRLRYRIMPRLMLLASMPIQFSEQRSSTGLKRLGGIGDFSLSSTYIIINKKDSTGKWSHDLQLSGGIKLPSGRYRQLTDDYILNPNLQAGTGSVDALVSLNYSIRKERWTFQWMNSGRINGVNSQRYRFGNRYMTQLNALRWIKWERTSLIPHAGLAFEMIGKDNHGSIILEQSGGQQLSMPFGFFLQQGRYIIQAQFTRPLWLSNYAINLNYRAQLNFFYSF